MSVLINVYRTTKIL